MKLTKLNQLLSERYGGKVQAREDEFSIILSGSLSSWQDIVSACQSAVDKKSGKYVVNDILLEGVEIPSMSLPKIQDKSLDNKHCDVLVIGGGISGTSILRELTKWNLSCLLVDKESDIAMQATGRNDGEVHPGVDLNKGSLKQHYVLLGNAVYDKVCRELDVDFRRCGQYVVFKNEAKKYKLLAKLFAWQRRSVCKVKGTRVVEKDELMKAEPEIGKNHDFAIYNPTAGCVSPYNLAIAYAENAVTNGAEVALNTAVISMKVENGEILYVDTNRGRIYPKIVVNAAGTFAEEVAKMAGDRFYSIHPRRGTNSILDKKAGHLVNTISSVKLLTKTNNHSKGGGMLHTVHDNVLVGPNAVETYEKENFATDKESIKEVFDKQRNTNPDLSERDIITYFTGVRGPIFEEDFVIGKGKRTKNLVHVAGIQSPGLTTAPAVAFDVSKMVAKELGAKVNDKFNPIRKGVPELNKMSDEERNQLIKENPDYGVIVCRCEEISRGEILDALKSPICVPTVDGIKKRIRPGMGRCQGGFCAPLVTQIIAEFKGCSLSEVEKANIGSNITFGETKEGEK